MRILHVSYSDLSGGGCVSAYRLHRALGAEGVDSKMLVAKKVSDDANVLQHPSFRSKFSRGVRARVEREVLRLQHRGADGQFALSLYGCSLAKEVARINPDVVNLHWTNGGFVSIKDVAALRTPIVWTLHDMWSFTGGCHYAYDCEGYVESCGNCPKLGSKRTIDFSRIGHWQRTRAWADLDMRIVTPSTWLGECVGRSRLFGHRQRDVIPYGLDLDIFRPQQRLLARERFGIASDVPVLCYGALASLSDGRKGYDLLLAALQEVREELVAMGAEVLIFGTPEKKVETDPETGLRCHHVGHLSTQEDIALAYNCADTFVAPSRADNLPNTVLESIACGTPVAAFSIGGMPDMVIPGVNGFLAEPFDTSELGKGIVQLLKESKTTGLREVVSAEAAGRYPAAKQANRYMELYRSLTGSE